VQPYFDRVAATVEHLGATRSVLRQVITLADDAATLPDTELRDPEGPNAEADLVPLQVPMGGALGKSPKSASKRRHGCWR
jgi:hypothetical protein